MSDDLVHLEQLGTLLLAQTTPAARRKLLRGIAQDLRRSQFQRIAAQQNPDGSAYAPRKANSKRDRIKRKQQRMFRRIAGAQYLKIKATDMEASVQFTGRIARIARVHQEGLESEVAPGGPRVRYAQRQLLGFTQADRDMIRDRVIAHLAGQ